MAEGMFRKAVREAGLESLVEIDSAGTHAYHVGEPPDRRAIAAAARRGIDLSGLRARMVDDSDFEGFDLLVAMDKLNREVLLDRSPDEYRERVRLMLEFAPATDVEDVPDPYYGGPVGFEHVLDLVEEASKGLLDELLARSAARRR
jgi:protein-tyrosine phosphatase